jgi:hypothetical protein
LQGTLVPGKKVLWVGHQVGQVVLVEGEGLGDRLASFQTMTDINWRYFYQTISRHFIFIITYEQAQ